ncbi:MAG: hypothetical protein U0Q18_08020 [Bryobacteraceae bacterium]
MQWLLEGDPAIRWQAMRDLTAASPAAVRREREQVPREGWGARLLDLQDPDGHWASGIYTPKWTSTTYTMLVLRGLGLAAAHPAACKACALLLDGVYDDGGINFWKRTYSHSEACVTGMVLSIASYFESPDDRLDRLAAHLLARQMLDGGWNCRDGRGATHSSFHTTISVLEGLRDYEALDRRHSPATAEAQIRDREFLLDHRLFRSHRTGAVVKSAMTRFACPPRWHYDIMRALDYFRDSGAGRDSRLSEAIEIVRKRRNPDGRRLLENRYAGKTFFEMEQVGRPSRWNTLRAMRILKWWDGIG